MATNCCSRQIKPTVPLTHAASPYDTCSVVDVDRVLGLQGHTATRGEATAPSSWLLGAVQAPAERGRVPLIPGGHGTPLYNLPVQRFGCRGCCADASCSRCAVISLM